MTSPRRVRWQGTPKDCAAVLEAGTSKTRVHAEGDERRNGRMCKEGLRRSVHPQVEGRIASIFRV